MLGNNDAISGQNTFGFRSLPGGIVAKQQKEDMSNKTEKMKRKAYESELQRLQGKLCQLQEWVKHTGARIIRC